MDTGRSATMRLPPYRGAVVPLFGRKRARKFIGLLIIACAGTSLTQAQSCPPPAVPLYSTVHLQMSASESKANYSCDTGYELFGPAMRICEGGRWQGRMPYCATNVALNKPSKQSSISTKNLAAAKLANDGDLSTVGEKPVCTETRVENSPWWQVDLLQAYEVRVVRILTRGCCGHQPLHDIEIRVSNSSSLTGSRLCAWFPGILEDGAMKEFVCAYPINGRYVSVQMVGGDGSLSLCEVQVFSTQELSVGMCGHFDDVVSILRNCYEFHLQGGSRKLAEEHCEKRGGLLMYNIDRRTLPFIGSELTRRSNNNQLNQGLVWIGATLKRGIGPGRRGWFWSNNEPIPSGGLLWGEGQPNNYNKQQNCIVLDQKLSWMFNDFNCDLDYLPWICQYEPVRCGSPDVSENSTLVGKDFGVLRTVKYDCPIGSVIQGDAERTCQKSGFWSGSAPTCKHIDCGPLKHIPNGKALLRDLRTTFNATAEYICDANYTLTGEDTRRCAKTGFWTGQEPKCQLNFCGTLSPPVNGSIQLEGVKAGQEAVYSCQRGHALVGVGRRKCMLGGQWTSTAPSCRYVDCGKPSPPDNGNVNFINSTWNYLSVVTYSCSNDYTLVNGDVTRTCNERGIWSGREPECKIIACPPPPIPNGAYIKADAITGERVNIHVHSNVEYGCLAGFKLMSGDLTRTCLKSGLWSGTLLHCQLVDCGRLPPILKGEIKYLNDSTTTLDSVITHSCTNGYRLVGSETRVCGTDGRWTGVSPRCEEIRCAPPEVAPNTTVLYSNNDRSSIDSFRVGSSVMYKCMAGHIIEGIALRTCLSTGEWDGTEPPTCHYIECGKPPPISNGVAESQTTHYGSLVEYRCDDGYRLGNGAERRLCLENGTWSGSEPVCVEVICPDPPRNDDRLLIESVANDDTLNMVDAVDVRINCQNKITSQNTTRLPSGPPSASVMTTSPREAKTSSSSRSVSKDPTLNRSLNTTLAAAAITALHSSMITPGLFHPSRASHSSTPILLSVTLITFPVSNLHLSPDSSSVDSNTTIVTNAPDLLTTTTSASVKEIELTTSEVKINSTLASDEVKQSYRTKLANAYVDINIIAPRTIRYAMSIVKKTAIVIKPTVTCSQMASPATATSSNTISKV
ncbi:CUB and sushi domain-containing protein 3-like isoform X2 [Varroa jacobsoni]|uniref:CUB and sushi domain-containing protein 3-like isoform X2 n=1 Tax=Varroa jacobsoni TaxID=62625 RepID=UPI000BF43A48|nr:CUB and sushi domain-containing protein 3-like isoform X2 [Varroa jacobsoni]